LDGNLWEFLCLIIFLLYPCIWMTVWQLENAVKCFAQKSIPLVF
jgi:hypothetical protein